MKKNILLLFGGGGTEHDISIISSKYIEKTINEIGSYNVIKVEIGKDKIFRMLSNDNSSEEIVELNSKKKLVGNQSVDIHFVIPCIHGPPGETGEIQTYLELINLPYLGCTPEASMICFNKVSSKLWFSALNIPNTPFVFLSSSDDKKIALDFFSKHHKVFVKAASQGSSVGCYQVNNVAELDKAIEEAFKFSPYILVEKMLDARELEISAYEFNGEIITTLPGEIICPNKFYSFEEKYDQNSKTTTEVIANNLPGSVVSQMREYAFKAFKKLKLRHLSRIDFFYTKEGDIYLNEINSFPGMTPISMFPKMMENHGHSFKAYLSEIISKNIL
jgi:D-alanine-D-alanine ligase